MAHGKLYVVPMQIRFHYHILCTYLRRIFSFIGKRSGKRKKHCDHFVIFLILAALIYGFYNFSEGFVENNRDGMSKYTKSLWQDSTAFELCLEFFIVAAAFYTVIVLLHKRAGYQRKYLLSSSQCLLRLSHTQT